MKRKRERGSEVLGRMPSACEAAERTMMCFFVKSIAPACNLKLFGLMKEYTIQAKSAVFAHR